MERPVFLWRLSEAVFEGMAELAAVKVAGAFRDLEKAVEANMLPVPGMGSFYDIIGWGSSIILGIWWHYTFYGDRKVIEDNYDAGCRYLEHLKTKVTPEGFISHGLGDRGNHPGRILGRESPQPLPRHDGTHRLVVLQRSGGHPASGARICKGADYGASSPFRAAVNRSFIIFSAGVS